MLMVGSRPKSCLSSMSRLDNDLQALSDDAVPQFVTFRMFPLLSVIVSAINGEWKQYVHTDGASLEN